MLENIEESRKITVKTVSLILTTYNCAENLKRTLQSIEQQDYPDIEVNIKDGGSGDDTLMVIKKYAETSHNRVNWITGKDEGIYDAMNQGYKLAGGDIIVFFNDLFLKENAITNMVNVIEKNPDCVGAHADLIYATDELVIRYWKMGKQKSLYSGWMPGHPTLFLKKEIYDQYGLYDPTYKVAADYEFMIRFLKNKGNKLAYLPEVIIRMYYGGTSTATAGSYFLSLKEGYRALRDNRIRGAGVINILRSFRVLLQFFTSKCYLKKYYR